MDVLRIRPLKTPNSHVTPLALTTTVLHQYVEPIIGEGDHLPPTKHPVLPAAVHIQVGDLDAAVSVVRKLERDQDEEGNPKNGRYYVYGLPKLIDLRSCDYVLRFLDSEDRSGIGNLFYYQDVYDISDSPSRNTFGDTTTSL